MLGVEGLFRPAAGRYQAVMPGSTPNDSEQAILRMVLADVGAMERPLTRWLTEIEAIDPLIFHRLVLGGNCAPAEELTSSVQSAADHPPIIDPRLAARGGSTGSITATAYRSTGTAPP